MLGRLPVRARLAASGATALLGGAAAYHAFVADLRSTAPYHWLVARVGMPAVRLLDPEAAHAAAVRAAAAGLAPVDRCGAQPLLETAVWGLRFRSPVGLAAGFDKHAEAIDGLLGTGFGFVEVGTVTPLPQPGNPTPRMFRLPEDAAVINRYGFNSDGKETVAERLGAFWRAHSWRVVSPEPAASLGSDVAAARHRLRRLQAWARPPAGLVGVNLGKNKDGDAVRDYTAGVHTLGPYADYLVVNVSSPNTPGLRDLQGRDALLALLTSVRAARDAIPWGSQPPVMTPDEVATDRARAAPGSGGAVVDRVASPGGGPWRAASDEEATLVFLRPTPPPLLVKIAPDVTEADLADIADVVVQARVDGVICTNTTLARPAGLRSAHAKEAGGLSGAPLREPSTRVLAKLYELTDGRVPLIGVGGVASGLDAYEKIRHGASLVQLYSALAYDSPGLVSTIKAELAAALAADGFARLSDAVGVDTAVGRKHAAAAAAAVAPAASASGEKL